MESADALDASAESPTLSDTVSPSSSLPNSQFRPFALPKNRSASNIYGMTSWNQRPAGRRGASFEIGGGGSFSEHDPLSSSISSGLGPSGLHRIRSNPSSRKPSLHRAASAVDARMPLSVSIPELSSIDITSNPGPATAGLLATSYSIGDDLRRFPAESLHSFSFSNLADETIHARHSILKRSIDFLREQPSRTQSQIGLAQAQARLSGDAEAQSMMELLARANLLSNGPLTRTTSDAGPLTGPADISNENVFERDFMKRSESPINMEHGEDPLTIRDVDRAITPIELGLPSDPLLPSSNALRIDTGVSDRAPPPRLEGRAALKRTYTDVSTVDLQNRLTDALAQPYSTLDNTLLSPILPSPHLSSGSILGSGFPSTAPSAHGRAALASQAIFTTDLQEPWTITASNDLACLAFGVTKAELRKIGILELVQDDKREWLRRKIKGNPPAAPKDTTIRRTSSPRQNLIGGSQGFSAMGSGITAKLLSKPSSRVTGQGRRTKTVGGSTPSPSENPSSPSSTTSNARGVLICGDVLPILKRNGAVGSATFWVQEKRSALIWVMEEIAEDVAFLDVDEIGCVAKGYGSLEGVWGMERVKPGVDVARLIPGIPRRTDTNTGALDFAQIEERRRYTARTANDISIPVTIDQVSGEPKLRVSSFPNIAGMIVVSASDLTVSSSNAVASETLFGRSPNGLAMDQIVPGFKQMLDLLRVHEGVYLEEGVVIPEYSFRRARATLALKEGKGDAAAVFLKPSGLPAIHRDGSQIMIDVQMRVVKSEAFDNDSAIVEEGDSESGSQAESGLVYALWVSYSRTTHAVNHGIGPVSPLVSRPGTPPHQPNPGAGVLVMSSDESDSEDTNSKLPPPAVPVAANKSGSAPTATQVASPPPTPDPPAKQPSSPRKKTIADFQILEEMGAGAYGQVKLARNKATAEKAVIKYVTKKRILVDTWTRDRRLGTVPLEIHVLDYLRRDGYKHPNIVEMSDFFEDDINYYIEMIPHGLPGMDLFDYIELRVNMDEAECKAIFVQVVNAIEFLHLKAKVVHRDIKDENIVLDKEGRVKLIDFGSASYIKNGPFDVFVGTIDYASPEVLAGRSYKGPEQDIWALGILLYTIVYKENPFYSIDEIMDRDLRIPFVMSEDSIDLIRLMLERDVQKRVDISQIVSHKWCQDANLPR